MVIDESNSEIQILLYIPNKLHLKLIISLNDIPKKNGKVSKEKDICYRERKKTLTIIG